MIEPLKVAAGLVLVAAAIYVLAPPLSTLTDRLPAPLHRAAIWLGMADLPDYSDFGRCDHREEHGRDLTRHEWALVATAVVTLAAIAALTLIALGKGWL